MLVGPIDSLDDLVDAIGCGDRDRASLALAAAELCVSGVWAADGFVSIGSWMQHHCRMTRTDAHKLLAEGRFLLRYTAVAQAAITGCLSGSQVRSIRSAVTAVLADLFDEHQATVVDAVTGLDPAATTQACQAWRQRGEATTDQPEPSITDRTFKWSKLEDGTIVGQFVFDPTSAATILKALETARAFDGDRDDRTHQQTHADAVTSIAAFFNANHDNDGTPRRLPHLGLELRLTQRTPDEVHDILHPDCDRTSCANHTACDTRRVVRRRLRRRVADHHRRRHRAASLGRPVVHL